MPDQIAVHTRNAHDDRLDIATGQDVSAGTVIGTIGWDANDPNCPGFVLTVYEFPGRCTTISTGDEVLVPDDTDEAVTMLARRGYRLDESSLAEIAVLAR